MLVDFRHRKLAQRAVGVLFFLERSIEQLDGVLVTKLVRPGLQSAVTRNFVMLDGLRRGKQAGVESRRPFWRAQP